MKSFARTFLKLFVFFVFSKNAFAQSSSFPGIRTGNYTGVQTVFFNPAEVGGSRYIFDLNLFGLNTGFGNNKASFSLSTVGSTFSGENALNSLFSGDGRLSGQLQMDVMGPSLLVSLPKKSGIAITSRLRGQFSFTDLDGKLAKSVLDDVTNEINFPYTISSTNNIRLNINGWAEYGLSYGRVIVDDADKLIKVGATLKYLAGAGNSYLQIDQLNATLTNNPTIPNSSVFLAPGSSGVVGLGISGNIGSLTPGDLLKSTSNGIGADLGVVYEQKNKNNTKHPYKFKLSASLLDIGSIKYTRDLSKSGTFAMLVTTSGGYNLQSLQGVNLNNYKQILSSNPNFIPSPDNNSPTIKVSLPTSLQLFGDMHVNGNIYVSAGAQLSMVKKSDPENAFVYSGFTITPRYEGKGLGLYLPINYNQLTDVTMGATLRMGPLFVGSGSILSAAFTKSKQADVHVGLHIGILKRTKKNEMNGVDSNSEPTRN